MFALNIISVTGLLFAYLATYISPLTTTFFAFFGLAYPIFLILNTLFIIYWFIRRKKKIYLSIFVFAIGWGHFTHFFQFPISSPQKTNTATSLSVLSYNVRLFDLYDWTKKNNVKQQITDLINQSNADIVCLQEYYMKGGNKKFRKSINKPYVYEYFSKNKKRKKTRVGSAIYSKYPIINKGKITFAEGEANHCIFIDIIKNKDTIRIYNAHLGSIHLDYEDYNFIASDKTKISEQDITPLKKVIKRLDVGFKKRASQVKQLLFEIKRSPYPIIVATDMNDTPVSYTYQQFNHLLNDSFVKKGKWIGSTYVGKMPWLRIDYIWYSNTLNINNFETIPAELSDHRPIYGEYSLNK